ncbi:Uncharacterised protein [Flavonifractor plautii]|uniref:Uncharacterized protein n=1 Tax=Flavonifractor plautii TaxID=292800 RepID=A0A174I7X7_FLAPL|nr:Uncharacterised protein [Flavonifractor plautii]
MAAAEKGAREAEARATICRRRSRLLSLATQKAR